MLHKPTSVRVVKRPDSRYYQLEYKDPMTGERRRESVHTIKRREAEAKAEYLQAQLNPMTVTPLSAGILFSNLTSEYIERHAQMRLAETTIIDYKRRIGVIKPYFNGQTVHLIGTPFIMDLIFDLKRTKNISNASCNRYIALLLSVFSYAMKRGYIAHNPVKNMDKFPEDSAHQPFKYFTESEVSKLISCAGQDFRPILAMAFYTGMRKGELIGLQWQDMDLERNFIQVSRSFDKSTKSGRIRHVGIHPELRNELVVPEENRHESIYVFPNPRTGAMRDNFNKAWYGAIRRSGIKYRRFHCTRHTFATKFLKSGGTTAELKEICGWSSQKMVDRYSHLSEEHKHLQQAINKMEY